LKPLLKGNQHYDEKYVKVKGEDCYDLNCMDNVTKFITAHLFVEKRTKKSCVVFLGQIKENCYQQILERYLSEKHKKVEDRLLIKFVSDKFANYKNCFNKLFYRVAKLEFGVPIAYKKHNRKHNNNPIERYNGKIKDRIKVMRGSFGSFDYANDFLNLRRVINNFVNPHQSLDGKTPAEEANIDLRLGRMKLYNLIKYRAKNPDDD